MGRVVGSFIPDDQEPGPMDDDDPRALVLSKNEYIAALEAALIQSRAFVAWFANDTPAGFIVTSTVAEQVLDTIDQALASKPDV